MKRSTISLIMAMLTVCSLSARQISPVEAMTLASDFMNNTELQAVTHGSKALRPMRAPGVEANSAESPYYVFNRGEADGFVIISGDDRAPKILGYSDKGSFDADNLPPQLKAMMEQWTTQMTKLPATAPQHASWTATASTRAGEGILMETAEWGQGYPYNALCPVIDGEQAPAGCVATAMAIAMKYHNWPDYTRGDLQTDYYYPELGFDFSNYSIDWNVLDDKNDPKFGEEVAKLMFGAGVCNSMIYGAYESSAEVWPIGHKMIELFTYSKGCQYLDRSKYSHEEWDSILKKQLEEVGPVIYRANGDVGHCFIVDGYDSSDMYHINWGWDGMLNGYYTIDLTDEKGGYFPYNHGMLIDLRPDRDRKEYSKAFIPNLDEYGNAEWNFFESEIKQGQMNTVLIPTITQNCHSGFYGLAVVDKEDNIKEIFYHSAPQTGVRYVCSYPGVILGSVSVVFPQLHEGERYQLVSMDATFEDDINYPGVWTWTPSRPSYNPSDWKIVLGGKDYPSFFYEKGNKSEVCEVTLHIDEDIPLYMECSRCYPTSEPITIKKLRRDDYSENFYIPKKGFSIDITGRNKDNTTSEIKVNSSEYDGSTNVYGMTLNMDQDYFDISVKYEADNDTRKDSGYEQDEIIEDKGIIYRILEDGASIIGYDNISESVSIPNEINTQKGILSVNSIEPDAFLHAPVKSLYFSGNDVPYSLFVDDLSFAGMDKLESVHFENDGLNLSFKYGYPFLKSKYKNIYFNRCPYRWTVQNILNIKHWVSNWDYWNQDKPFDSASSDQKDVEIYISNPIGNPEYDYSLFLDLLEYVGELKNIYHKEDIIAHINIPGIGESSTALAKVNEYDVPVSQMWSYSIDLRKKIVSLSNVKEDIIIDAVLVNDQIIELNSNGQYEYTSSEINEIEVVVCYTVNGNEKLQTKYSSDYNAFLAAKSNVCLVESIHFSPEEWNGEEGETFKIEAIVMPEDATDKSLVWSSSDETVATVDSEGNVSVLKEGSCVITATAADGSGVSAECIITSAAGVEGIFSEAENFDVYEVNGLLVKKEADRDALKALTPGIYIIRQGSTIKKLVIR